MNEQYFERTKGQSAIEYLMTYGWMLLVVAIVGGAIFATVQGQCVQSTSGFTGADVQVENFGIDGSNNLQMELRNGGSETLTVDNVTVENSNGNTASITGRAVEIGVGGTSSITVNDSSQGFESSDGCNDFDLTFEYDAGELTGQQITGSLTDSIQFN